MVRQGLKVLGIQIDGPVNRAGIIRDEHLSIVDGIPLNSSADLEAYKKETTPGDILDFRVIRCTPVCYHHSFPSC